MTLTTAQSISGGPWTGSGGSGGAIVAIKDLGPPSTVSPPGFTASISGTNPTTPAIGSPGGIASVSTGFDPVVVAGLQVVLPSTGWIWPVPIS
jgi:hypothetical protein